MDGGGSLLCLEPNKGGAMRKTSLVTAALIILILALAGPSAAGPAYAALQIVHAPPGAAIAGRDLALTFTVVTNCPGGGCLPVEVQFTYATPWGTSESVALEGNSTGSTVMSVTVPGNAVRYPSIKYNISATQKWYPLVSSTWDTWASTRSPATGDHEVSVIHKLELQAKNANGAPLSNAKWDVSIDVADEDDSPIVLQGRTGSDGLISATIPITSDVLRASQKNGGVANMALFIVCFTESVADLTCAGDDGGSEADNDVNYLVDTFYVNVQDSAEDSEAQGITSLNDTERLVHEEVSRASGGSPPCYGYWHVIGRRNNAMTNMAEINTDYGLRGVYKYGEKANSDFDLAAKFMNGSWSYVAGGTLIRNSEIRTSVGFDQLSGSNYTRHHVYGNFNYSHKRRCEWSSGYGDYLKWYRVVTEKWNTSTEDLWLGGVAGFPGNPPDYSYLRNRAADEWVGEGKYHLADQGAGVYRDVSFTKGDEYRDYIELSLFGASAIKVSSGFGVSGTREYVRIEPGCRAGWTFYYFDYVNQTRYHADMKKVGAPEYFVDAGYYGDALDSRDISKPTGCI